MSNVRIKQERMRPNATPNSDTATEEAVVQEISASYHAALHQDDQNRTNLLLIHACNCDDAQCSDHEFRALCSHMKRFLRAACWASHTVNSVYKNTHQFHVNLSRESVHECSMDGRVSTAPAPKSKKWPPKDSSDASCLVRHTSVKSTNPEVDRPRTCPILAPTLTPQFHWNLNNSALEALCRDQIEQLYRLFEFYDSSTFGDTLPSINCTRLQEILRDARILGTNMSEKKLLPEVVEKIFAQAVMGKMRVYLDSDDQPALTFPLFCGALMNCAMMLTPLTRPATALQQLLSILLESFNVDDNMLPRVRGLLRHIPSGGSTSLWAPKQSQIPPQEETLQDFRDQSAFQQVIADCTHDQGLEEFKQEKLKQYYKIPDRLLASFHPDTLALISNKFRMFDVNDTGTVPRQELFALLSCLGTRVDLPDSYTVLAKLPTVVQRSGKTDSNGGEITLVQLLQVIEVAREAKRHSATSNLAAIKIRVDRAATTVRGSITPLTSQNVPGDDDNSNSDCADISRKASGRNKSGNTANSASFRDRGRRHGVVAIKPRKSILSSTTEASASSKSLLGNKHQSGSKTHPSHHPSGSNRKKAAMRRRTSSVANAKPDSSVADSSDVQDNTDNESVIQTQRSGTTVRSTAREPAVLTTGVVSKGSDDHNLDNNDNPIDKDDHGFQLEYVPRTISVQVYEPLSSNSTKTIRIFLLLGGEHDGAIYCTISLVFSTRKIEEREGIYYSTAPSETTRTTPVLPTQHNLINALLMLKKCVLAKLEQGFVLRPADQLDIVDDILQEQRNRQPHYSSPVTKTSRNNTISVYPSPDARHSARFISSASPDHIENSRLRPKKLPPHSKRDHYQFDLPNNYKDLFSSWDISQHGNYEWIHDINAASPLKPATPTIKLNRSGLLSPIQLPSR